MVGQSSHDPLARKTPPGPPQSPDGFSVMSAHPNGAQETPVTVTVLIQMVLGSPKSFATMASRSPSASNSPRASEVLALFPMVFSKSRVRSRR